MFARIFAVCAVVVTLGGCATLPGPLGDVVNKLTATVNNPVDDVDIYRVENVYAATLEVAAEYRRYCYVKPYRQLMADPVAKPICQRRRDVVRAIQVAQRNASAALVAARNFVRDNPTLNAAGIVGAAWRAVSDFKSAVPATN